jgi:hypothetical protein
MTCSFICAEAAVVGIVNGLFAPTIAAAVGGPYLGVAIATGGGCYLWNGVVQGMPLGVSVPRALTYGGLAAGTQWLLFGPNLSGGRAFFSGAVASMTGNVSGLLVGLY